MASNLSDTVLRAMTDDGVFRVMVARTTRTVSDAIRTQHAYGDTAQYLAELITGAILVRETMAPQLRVQGILVGARGQGRLVADAHPDGSSRALVQRPKGSDSISLGGQASLEMMRTLPSGAIHRGLVEVPLDQGISGALMTYMQASEQVTSMVSVGCVLDGDQVIASGGYLLQLLPEAPEGPLMLMTERLRDFVDIRGFLAETDAAPEPLLHELLYGMPHTLLGRSSLRFGCTCSRIRVMASLATLDRREIEDMIRVGEIVELTCDFCGTQYRVSPSELRGLSQDS
jgi:molecular chaperone Hsp33